MANWYRDLQNKLNSSEKTNLTESVTSGARGVANFTESQLEQLRKAYSTVNGIDPSTDKYKQIIKMFDNIGQRGLKQLADANIKFVSELARNRLSGELTEGNIMADLINDGFIKHKNDIDGILKYLTSAALVPNNSVILPFLDFENLDEEEVEELKSEYNGVYTYHIHLDERGSFYATVDNAFDEKEVFAFNDYEDEEDEDYDLDDDEEDYDLDDDEEDLEESQDIEEDAENEVIGNEIAQGNTKGSIPIAWVLHTKKDASEISEREFADIGDFVRQGYTDGYFPFIWEIEKSKVVSEDASDDVKHVVKLISPEGETFWLVHDGFKSEDREKAIQFKNKKVANGAAIDAIHGARHAFWGSERDAANRHAKSMKGWKAEVEPVDNVIEEAYMSQDNKKRIAELVKPILQKYKLKGSLRVSNRSKITLTLKSGNIDFFNNLNEKGFSDNRIQYIKDSQYLSLHHSWSDTFLSGSDAEKAVKELFEALMSGNHDNSDIQTDYFDVGWYTEISIGAWDKPYVYTGAPAEAVTEDGDSAVQTEQGPSAWASYLINGDSSGLDEDDIANADAYAKSLRPYEIVGVHGVPYFSHSYAYYDPRSASGEVVDYEVVKHG